MEKYAVWNGIECELETFDTEKDAEDHIKDMYIDKDEGVHPDIESCLIYKLHKEVIQTCVLHKDDCSKEEWAELGKECFDFIVEVKFQDPKEHYDNPKVGNNEYDGNVCECVEPESIICNNYNTCTTCWKPVK